MTPQHIPGVVKEHKVHFGFLHKQQSYASLEEGMLEYNLCKIRAVVTENQPQNAMLSYM